MKVISAPPQVYALSFLTLSGFIALFGFLAFTEHSTWVDPLFGLLLYIGVYLIYESLFERSR